MANSIERPSEPIARENSPVAESYLARIQAFRIPGVVTKVSDDVGPDHRHNYYIDIDPILNDPAESDRVVRWYAETLRRIRSANPKEALDALAFIEKAPDTDETVGIIRLAGAISIEAQVPHIVVRLRKKDPAEQIKFKSLHDPELPPGFRFADYTFAVITEHCTSGALALKAMRAVEANGGHVRHLLTYSIIVPEFRWDAFLAKGIDVHPFLRAPDDLLALGPIDFDVKQV